MFNRSLRVVVGCLKAFFFTCLYVWPGCQSCWLRRWGLCVITVPLSIRIRAANRGRAILWAFITLFSVHPPSVCSSSAVRPCPGNQEKRRTQRSPAGSASHSNMKGTCCEEPGGDGFVILVIKDRVASMPGVRTGCGKLPESLQRKAAPSLFCPFPRDLIIFSNSQDGILYPLFPHLFFRSPCLCSFPFTSLCHFVLKTIWNSELTKKSWQMGELSEWNLKPLLNVFRTIIVLVGSVLEHLPRMSTATAQETSSYFALAVYILFK